MDTLQSDFFRFIDELCSSGKSSRHLPNILNKLSELLIRYKSRHLKIIPATLLNFGKSNSIHRNETLCGIEDFKIDTFEVCMKYLLCILNFIIDSPIIDMNITKKLLRGVLKVQHVRMRLSEFAIRILMKWLKNEILIRQCSDVPNKGVVCEKQSYPISFSSYIINNILLRSIKAQDLKTATFLVINNIYKFEYSNSYMNPFFLEYILVKDYLLNYDNLRYHFALHIRNLLEKICYKSGNSVGYNTEKRVGPSLELYGCSVDILIGTLLRISFIILNLPKPVNIGKFRNKTDFERGERELANIYKTTADYGSLRNEFEHDSWNWQDKYKTVYHQLWIVYLHAIINMDCDNEPSIKVAILKHLLHYIPINIMPYLTNPLEMADAYVMICNGLDKKYLSTNKLENTALSASALSGLFFLIVNYRLNEDYSKCASSCTGYYYNLYSTISVPIFNLPQSSKFLNLLSLSLSSPMLPLKLLAKFIKKLIRVSAISSPSSSVLNLILVKKLFNINISYLNSMMSLDNMSQEFNLTARLLRTRNGDQWDYYKIIGDHENIYSSEYSTNIMLSIDLGLWELYLLRKHIVPCIRHISNSLILESRNIITQSTKERHIYGLISDEHILRLDIARGINKFFITKKHGSSKSSGSESRNQYPLSISVNYSLPGDGISRFFGDTDSLFCSS
ncbi:hypothetical protein cand_000130 [Cryptosporidium andersoni]|uniref:CCAAT-binding factor domain-containing protein n=1 Tax=Cryptosporidium andersoni TaxID=117008 RepID=A0A1J4MUR7_9CRYT|nr:hypothetical protein cand_000130 [Cryptosporidium andersoni]